jgi:RNA-binding protein YlmH
MSHKLRLGAIINNNKNMSKNNMSHKLRLGAIIVNYSNMHTIPLKVYTSSIFCV